MKKQLVFIVFLTVATLLIALPSLLGGSYGYNRANELNFSQHVYLTMEEESFNKTYFVNSELNSFMKTQTDTIPLGVDISKLSESKEQIELDNYSQSLNTNTSVWGQKHPLFDNISQNIQKAVKNYNDTVQIIQEYPNKQIERWNLPPQININANTHSRRLQMQFSEPMYLGL